MTRIADTAAAASPTRRPARAAWVSPFRLFALARQRHQLSDLSDEQLDDIGFSRAEAEAEAARPFWDVPPHWQNRS